MAYTPTAEDWNDNQGYTPTTADWNAPTETVAPETQGWTGIAHAFGRGVLDPIADLFKSGIIPGTQVAGQLNAQLQRYSPGLQQTESKLSLQHLLPTAADIGQPSFGQSAAHFAGGFIPQGMAIAAAPEVAAAQRIPLLGRLLAPAAQKSAIGLGTLGVAQNPEHPIAGGLESGALALGLGQIPGIAGAAKTGISKGLAALRAPAEAERMVREAVGKLPQDVMNKQNNESLLQNADKKQAIASTKYQDVADTAEVMGFASDKNPEGQIKIKPYPQLTRTLNKIPDNIGINKKLIATIGRYKNNPTYENAHKLQSHLGKEAERIDAKLVKNPTDDNTVDALRDARGAVNTRIEQAFNYTGNKNLIKKYKNASDYYKTEVRPYHDKPEIYRMMQGKQYPHDVLNVISEHDPKGYNDKIRQDIKKNPFQSRSFMAQALQKHVNPSNAEKGLTLDDIINGYKDIPTEIKTIGKNTQLAKNMGALEQAAKTRKTIAKTVRGTKIAGTTLGGIGASIWGLKKILG